MKLKVGIQGIRGSFSYSAAKKFFLEENIVFLELDSFRKIFESLENNKIDYGVIPIENSIAGSVYENYDYLNKFNVKICGEVFLKIEHFLLGIKSPLTPRLHLRLLRRVYSHPKALEQCKKFFDKYPHLERIAYSDTARAAKLVSESNDLTLGAIASRECRRLYKLRILQEHIEDFKNNYTRFLIICHPKSYKIFSGVNKCSLIFILPHKPGSLYKALEVFEKNNINLTKIESRPIPQKPFEYLFFLDFEFYRNHKNKLPQILAEFEKKTIMVKSLGFYKSAKIK